MQSICKSGPELQLLPIAEHAMQVPVQEIRVLNVEPLRPPAAQALEDLLLGGMSSAEARRGHLEAPSKAKIVEKEKVHQQLTCGLPDSPPCLCCAHLRVIIALAIRLKCRGGQGGQLHVNANLQKVDRHQGEGVRRQMTSRCATNLCRLCPKLDCDDKFSHLWVHLGIGTQQPRVLQGMQILAREIDLQTLIILNFQDRYFCAENFLHHFESWMRREQRLPFLTQHYFGLLMLCCRLFLKSCIS
mmetsp:Transcript_125675/g.314076  ORF Transcript_125675/g.314076 Transcript_125675/m.314076 type:complete len:244 (-) Transcript_125675:725-1456(-)